MSIGNPTAENVYSPVSDAAIAAAVREVQAVGLKPQSPSTVGAAATGSTAVNTGMATITQPF
jgi:3-oxoacyl-(acyl-carrier-protein) synthase